MNPWQPVRPRKARTYGALAAGALLIVVGCRESSARSEMKESASQTATVKSCGIAGQPDCPTQRWMKSTLQAYLRTADFKRLQGSLEVLGARAPEGYAGWASMAESGSKAAAAGDEAGVRKSCQSCHDNHRSRFRQQDRALELL